MSKQHCIATNNRPIGGTVRRKPCAQSIPKITTGSLLHTNHLFLEGEHTKSGKRRVVPLNEEARRAMLNRARYRAEFCPASLWVFSHRNGERVGNVQNGFQAACKRAEILNFRVHDLRHTCASWMVQHGVPLSEVRDVLGHAGIVMTERYAHLAPDNLKTAVSVLDRLRTGYAVSGEVGRTFASP